jgi:hypothetical protein
MQNSQAAAQQLMMQVAQALQQGADPQEVAQQLMQMGYTQEQVVAIIQQVAGQGQMAMGGSTNSTYYQGMSYANGGGVNPYMYTDPYSYMAMGGMIPTAEMGMETPPRPEAQDFPDYGSFKAADEAWMSQYGENAIQMPDDYMMDYEDPTSIAAYNNPALAMVQSQVPVAYSPVQSSYANNDATDVKLKLIDFITKIGGKTDFKTRAGFAKAAGITNYKGTPDQDNNLFEYLRIHADIVSRNPKTFNIGRKEANQIKKAVNTTAPTTPTNTPAPVNIPTNDTIVNIPTDTIVGVNDTIDLGNYNPPPGGFDSTTKVIPSSSTASKDQGMSTGSVIGLTAGTAGVLGTGAYLANKELNALKGFGNLYAGKSPEDIAKIIKNRGYRLPGDYEQLTKAGMAPAEATSSLKGLQFPEGAMKTNAVKLEKALTEKVAKANIQTAKDVAQAYKNRFKTAKPILQKVKQAGVRTAEDVEALKNAGLSSKEIAVSLKGTKLPTVTKTAGIGTRSAEAIKAALEASKIGKNTLGFLKGASRWFKEDGGSVGYVPNYGMAYGGYVPQAMYGMGMAQGGSIYKEGRDLRDYTRTAAYTPGGWSGYPVDLPPVGWGTASYAAGGQMPQWLAERRFTAAGNRDKMSEYGYADGGMVVGQEMYATPEQLQMLQQGGYQFEIMK